MMFPFCMDCVAVPISAESERHRFPEKICPHDGNAEAPLWSFRFMASILPWKRLPACGYGRCILLFSILRDFSMAQRAALLSQIFGCRLYAYVFRVSIVRCQVFDASPDEAVKLFLSVSVFMAQRDFAFRRFHAVCQIEKTP